MASLRSFGQRLGALILALVFLGSTVAFTAAVIWQIRKTNKGADMQLSDQDSDQTSKLQGTVLSGFTPVEKVDSLQIIDLTAGDGEAATADSIITAHYTGAQAKDGLIFQSSLDGGQPFTSDLKVIIEGWRQGIVGMKAGGKRRLIIPYALAYGDAGRPEGGIPPKADLVFDIELLEVQ